MLSLDPRLITITLQVNGGTKVFDQNLSISARGAKYGNAIFNDCEVTIANLDKATQDFILTETSPYNLNRTPKLITIDAGRVSYGISRIFAGSVFTSRPTQPPDISVILRCIENGFNGGNIVRRNYNDTPLSQIAGQIAKDNNLTLIFEANDRLIGNYTFNGPVNGQLDVLEKQGLIDVFQDGLKMVVKNQAVPLQGGARIINASNGMIGIPELNERGCIVKFLLDNRTTLGAGIVVESDVYPAANGLYTIYKLDFEIASRDTAFYYTASGQRLLNS